MHVHEHTLCYLLYLLVFTVCKLIILEMSYSCVVTRQGDGVPYLASLLRKNHRALRLSTLLCLDEIVKNYGGFVEKYILFCDTSWLFFFKSSDYAKVAGF